MQRKIKTARWIASVAALALVAAGLSARAADQTPPTATATVTVKVVDADAKPVAGAQVSLVVPTKGKSKKAKGTAAVSGNQAAQGLAAGDAGAAAPPAEGGTKKGGGKPVASATTDDAGVATLKNVPDGSYNVRIRATGFTNGRAKVVVADGKDATVDVKLEKSAG